MLLLKVCGMRDQGNIESVATINPDFMGFIFYDKSPRFVSEPISLTIDSSIKKVGVFVNSTIDYVLSKVEEYSLDIVQLHGNESVSFVEELRSKNLKIIKVLRVIDSLPVDEIERFDPYVDYFLFDTKTEDYGGSGRHFDWNILFDYKVRTPFLLSGGIDLEDIEIIKKLGVTQLIGIDVNSRFEIEPGLKDQQKLNELRDLLMVQE